MTMRTEPFTLRCWLAGVCLVLCGVQMSRNAQAAAPAVSSATAITASAPAHSIPDAPASNTQTSNDSPKADADANREAEADRLFREGLELMRADQCPKAIERFEQSQHTDPSAATLINMAICYERLGKTAAAWRTFVQAVDAAVSEGNTELRSQAAAGLSKLGPILTRVRIVTSKAVEAQTVLVNGEPVSDYRDPIPVDPGETVIEVVAPGRKPWRMTVQAKRMGSVIVVEVPELAPARSAPPKHQHRTDLRPAALIAGGVGVVGLTAGAIWAVRAKSANDDANEQGICNASSCDQRAHELRETAWDRARVATWVTALGLTAVATGAVLWVVSPSTREKAEVGITPWIDPKSNVGGLVVGGRL